jgi:hypothetical protein
MYATKSNLHHPVEAVQQPQEPLIYWTDARTASAMARPNPSVSNCGLVIVQVQPEQRGQFEAVEAVTERSYYPHEHEQQQQQPQLTNWSNITLDNRIFHTDGSLAGHHQIIHEHPTTAQIVEITDKTSASEAVPDHEDEDEGYRTSPGSGNSPQSSQTDSPPPKVAKKSSVPNVGQRPPGGPMTADATAAAARRNGGGGRKDGNNEETNNLMWLLDFKLDFFNEAEAAAAASEKGNKPKKNI